MQAVAHAQPVEPMIEMNTTPLIDVMLVLLIMFIITIPPATHAVDLDLPQGPQPPAQLDPIKNKIVVTADGRILWNGTSVGSHGLRHQLVRTAQMQPQPELHLQPEEMARYALVDQVLAETKRAQVTKMGFVGNEQYRDF